MNRGDGGYHRSCYFDIPYHNFICAYDKIVSSALEDLYQADVRPESSPCHNLNTIDLQGNPSDSESLKNANASEARALVFLAHSHRPSRVSPRLHNLLAKSLKQL